MHQVAAAPEFEFPDHLSQVAGIRSVGTGKVTGSDACFTRRAGLLDVRHRTIWIPRFAAAKGHAALLVDGNTDHFFKFEFFIQSQAPRRLLAEGGTDCGHLLLHFIQDWSYSRHDLIPAMDDRLIEANRREQQRYAATVATFYGSCQLHYGIAVDHLIICSGKANSYALNVGKISGRGPTIS